MAPCVNRCAQPITWLLGLIDAAQSYCGLPLCVGWRDAQEVSVEAVGSLNGDTGALGLDNLGISVMERFVSRVRFEPAVVVHGTRFGMLGVEQG